MKQLVIAGLLSVTLSGCVVVPARVAVAPPEVVAPAGVVYVAPTYAMPAPGFVWSYHARYGWGWRHPRQGWHRGWH
jgi:hypothetical protein